MIRITKPHSFFWLLFFVAAPLCASGSLAYADDDFGSSYRVVALDPQQQNALISPSTVNTAAQPAVDQNMTANNQAVLSINGTYDISPTNSINGGTNYGIETTLYSAKFYNNWRLFAGEYYSHEVEPIGEGSIGYARSMAGVQYDSGNFNAEIAPTFNHYDTNLSTNDRVGVTGDATWYLNQNWALGGGGQLFSRDIPLRALNAGITANSYNGNVAWTDSDKRDVRVDADLMTFSDSNVRSSLSGAYTEHMFANAHWKIDGLGTLAESQDTKNEDRPYFNPAQDVQAMVGGRVTEPLYTGYGWTYQHSLEVTPGVYWQENYGDSPAFSAYYKQEVSRNGNFDADIGLIYSRQAYDGVAQNDEVIMFDVTERF